MKIDDPRLFLPQCKALTPVATVYENPWFIVRNWGGYFTTEYRRQQVVILPVVENHSIVMVKVKRPIIADNTLELPAGAADQDEAPIKTAVREFREEIGVKIDRLDRFQLLPSIAISPNRYPVLPWIYQVDLSKQEFDARDPHDDEVVSVECFTFEEVKEKIIQREIYVSLPLAIVSRFLFLEE